RDSIEIFLGKRVMVRKEGLAHDVDPNLQNVLCECHRIAYTAGDRNIPTRKISHVINLAAREMSQRRDQRIEIHHRHFLSAVKSYDGVHLPLIEGSISASYDHRVGAFDPVERLA